MGEIDDFRHIPSEQNCTIEVRNHWHNWSWIMTGNSLSISFGTLWCVVLILGFTCWINLCTILAGLPLKHVSSRQNCVCPNWQWVGNNWKPHLQHVCDYLNFRADPPKKHTHSQNAGITRNNWGNTKLQIQQIGDFPCSSTVTFYRRIVYILPYLNTFWEGTAPPEPYPKHCLRR